MLTELLFFTIGHFTITVFQAFVYFAASLLFLDAWQIRKHQSTPLIRGLGFFGLAVSAILQATTLENLYLADIIQFLKVSGFLAVLVSIILEPLLHKPTHSKLQSLLPVWLPIALSQISAVFALNIAIWYFRRATEGFDKQLKPAAIAFVFFSIAEFLLLPLHWADTSNVFMAQALAEYGPVWILSHLFDLGGSIILGAWTWGYIRFRVQIQLFVSTIALTLVLFISTTFFFTFLLLRNLETDALAHLKTDVNVLQYAIDRLQLETLSHATSVAQDSDFKEAFATNDPEGIYEVTSNRMLSQGTNFMTVTDADGQVLMRAEDRDQIGDYIQHDPLVASALAGQQLATIVTVPGITSPQVFVKAAVPLRNSANSTVSGTLVTGFVIDSTFVDGVKEVTGLDVTVFGDKTRAATTFTGPDGTSRYVGTHESNSQILDTVLTNNEIYTGASQVLNQPFFTVYSPLKTQGDIPIGMLFVGKPQTTLLETAEKSIQSTFVGSVVLMILALIPAYLLSRYIREHLEA